ncbi:hypothetical protein SteCoe_1914 [Stentor coeruleus]|uniref:Uncharacterized protein n=1 Tax=Stentor coeruleus TaxID=5963 RepID=A0A1R2D0W0_9CILI|nr:hypothetical protein SteCoe_1914 [Stentor coeruleus]
MVEKFTLFTSSPFVERTNVHAVIKNCDEMTKIARALDRDYQKVKSENIYTFYQTERNSIILVAVETDFQLKFKAYEDFFLFLIQNFRGLYGNRMLFSLPECDNFQSIAMGFINACEKYISQDVEIKIYVESAEYSIIKPLIDKLNGKIRKNTMLSNYALSNFLCTECGKFAYTPMIKKCCKTVICARCGLRDKTSCGTCKTPLDDLKPFEEIKALCNNAPYMCACGKVIPFNQSSKHIQECYASEIECRICNEMTKFTSFCAHLRSCHMDILKKDINLI